MRIDIHSCNNVERAILEIPENETTVLLGMNGTGKSTVANAIMAMAKNGALPADMLPYGSQEAPSVKGVAANSGVLVFNEQYVEDVLFKGDLELIADGYRIFIATDEYRRAAARTEELLHEAKRQFTEECDVDELYAAVTDLLKCYGRSKSGYAINSPLGRGVAKSGDLITNVPQQFLSFSPLINDDSGAKWIQWHKGGMAFVGYGVCPFCGTGLDQESTERCAVLQETYGSKYLDHCYTVFEAFGNAKQCLSEKTQDQVEKAIHGKLTTDGPTPEVVALFSSIREDASALQTKLELLRSLGFQSMKASGDKAALLNSLKISIDSIDKMDSPYVRERVEHINQVINGQVSRIQDIQAALGRQASALNRSIARSKSDIDGFLEAAGFPYELGLSSDDGSGCSVYLKPKGLDFNVAEPKSRLSYGERNALAIALFAAQVKSESPSLVVLDDPISSFDQNKKYAIMQRLFTTKHGVCKGVTTLLLTHDFETLVMLQRVHRHRMVPMSFLYASSANGQMAVTPIDDEDLGSVIQRLVIVAGGSASLPLRISSARRAMELSGEKGPAWSVLSCLVHHKEEPTVGRGDNARELTDGEWASALRALSEYGFRDFEYKALYEETDANKLVALYNSSTLPVEKICAFRMLAKSDTEHVNVKVARDKAGVSDVVFEYADEFYHVENLLVYQLDPLKYNMVPSTVLSACDRIIGAYETMRRTSTGA